MSLSKKTQEILTVALANKAAAQEMVAQGDTETASRIAGDLSSQQSAVGSVDKHRSAPRKEKLTWSATDVANQFKALRYLHAVDSVDVSFKGGIGAEGNDIMEENVDYTVCAGRTIDITCVADVAGSLNNKYILIGNAAIATNYYAWFNVDGAGVAPQALADAGIIPGGVAPVSHGSSRIPIAVAITSNSSAATVALALSNALKGVVFGGLANLVFQGPIPSTAVCTVFQPATGQYWNLTAPDAGNSGFTVVLNPPNNFSYIVLRSGGQLAGFGLPAGSPTLASSTNYGILAATAITNSVDASIVNGNMGQSTGSAVTGTLVVAGLTNLGNASAATAHADALAAYTAMAAHSSTVIPSVLDGQTLTAGYYSFSSGAATLADSAPGTLTLSGSATDIFVIKTATTLTTGTGGKATITLTGGAIANNVYWVIGSTATLNVSVPGTFVGTLIANTDIINTSGGIVNGRLIALNGVVTLSATATINVPGINAVTSVSPNNAMLVKYMSKLENPLLGIDKNVTTNLYTPRQISLEPTLPATNSTRYWSLGQGEPIVYAIATNESWKAQQNLARDLAERFTFYTANGAYGSSLVPYPDDGHALGEEVSLNQMISFVEKLNSGPVHLLGHGGLGKNMVRMAQLRPDLIKSLIIADPFMNYFTAGAANAGYLTEFDPIAGAAYAEELRLINDEMAAMINGTWSNDGGVTHPFASATQDQRDLSSRVLLAQWVGAVPATSAPRTSTDGSGTRTYLNNFQSLISTPASATVANQFNIEGVFGQRLNVQSYYNFNSINRQPVPITMADLRAIKVPVLLLQGTHTAPCVNLSIVSINACMAAIPDVTKVIIPGGFMASSLFQPFLSADAIMNWLRDKFPNS